MSPSTSFRPAGTRAVAGLTLLCAVASASAGPDADRFAGVEITTRPVGGGVYMLEGAGGNIGVLPGPDGTLMIDDQFAPLAPKIRDALEQLGAKPPRFLLNTHFHGDHTGGNAAFADDATIIAHHNVRIRLQADADTSRDALPIMTFAEGIRLFVNGERIDVIHLPNGHTDGDSIVWFRNAGVVHLGDHFFHGRYPFVDLENGGSVRGMLENVREVLSRLADDVRIIPGHGPLADVDDLRRYAAFLEDSLETVAAGLERGDSRETIIERGLPERWSQMQGQFIDESRWMRIVLAELEGAE